MWNMGNNTTIEPGQVVTIHSLESAGGQKLNGKDGLVLRRVKDDHGEFRFQVRVRGAKPIDATSAVKPANLSIKPGLPLPEGGGRPRGYVQDVLAGENMCPILAELLVMHTEHYDPPQTKLTGFPAMAFTELGQDNFTGFTAIQMEWVAATYALGNIIKKGGPSVCEDVLFALLEGDPMYVDVFIVTMTNTPFIGPEEKTKGKMLLFHEFRDARHQLTPDQESPIYIKTLKTGPLHILQEATKLKMGAALIVAMRKSKVFHLLIQRFLRLVAREGMRTPDGKELGPICRDLLPKLCDSSMPDTIKDLFQEGPMSMECGTKLLDHVSDFNSIESFPGAFKSTLGSLSHRATVSKYLSMLNRRKK